MGLGNPLPNFSGKAEATNFKFGVPYAYYEYYAKKTKN